MDLDEPGTERCELDDQRDVRWRVQAELEAGRPVLLEGVLGAGKRGIARSIADPSWAEVDLASVEALDRFTRGDLGGRDGTRPPTPLDRPVWIAAAQLAAADPGRWCRFVDRRSAPTLIVADRRIDAPTGWTRVAVGPRVRRERRGEQGRLPFVTRFLVDFRCREEPVASALRREEWLSGGLCDRSEDAAPYWFPEWEQRLWSIAHGVGGQRRGFDALAARRLAVALARQDGPLNLTSAAREAGASPTTAARLLETLESLFLFERLPALTAVAAPRQVRAARLLPVDSSWANWLTAPRADEEESTSESAEEAAVATRVRTTDLRESYVLQNLVSLFRLARPESRFHSWEIQARHRLDLVVETGLGFVPIAIATDREDRARAERAIEAFAKRTPDLHVGLIVHYEGDVARVQDRTFALPAALVLS